MVKLIDDIINIHHDDNIFQVVFSGNTIKSSVFPESYICLEELTQQSDETDVERMWRHMTSIKQPMESLGFYFLTEARLHGSGFIFHNDALLDMPDIIPQYIRDEIKNGSRWDFKYEATGVESVEETAIVFVSDAHKVYGHWLVDILPRLYFFQKYFGKIPSDVKYLIPSDTPEFAQEMLKNYFNMSNDNISFFNFPDHDVILKKAIIPSLLHVNHIFHPIINEFVNHILEKSIIENKLSYNTKPGRRIFVSRHKYRETSKSFPRNIQNEDEMLSFAASMGLEIICPEDYSLGEQALIFDEADVVVGDGGSGLHNAIFSKQSSVVVCLDPPNNVQGMISRVRCQDIIYLCSENVSSDPMCISRKVDLKRFQMAIEAAYKIIDKRRG